MMNYKKSVYKTCIVPECKNTSVSAPNKLFISLPADQKTRRAWQRAMRRTDYVSDKGSRYCCEDHFNVEEDIENYMFIKTMKTGRIKIKDGVIPHLFDCQKTRTPRHISKPRPLFTKREQLAVVESCMLEIPEDQLKEVSGFSLSKSVDRGIQVNIKAQMSSKYVQCRDECFAHSHSSAKKRKNEDAIEKLQVKKRRKSETLSSDEWSSNSLNLSASTSGSTFSSESSTSNLYAQKWNSKENVEKRAFYVIEKDPKLYLGIPKDSLFITELLSKKCKINKTDIFITLKKIRLNLPYKILADDFFLSPGAVCLKIQNTLPLLARYLKPFIQWKSPLEVKKNLPIAFRHRYKNVQCIIDCFEISLQKPSDPVLQSLTWSQYKGCNTMKYLIACTPDGLISFVSNGFGGRSSDKMIVEKSEFLTLIEPGVQVMADRGFKNLEEQLAVKNAQLVRPPSVSSGIKSTKEEVKHAKQIASLRIHIERVISRIREFSILSPHAQIHSKLIKYLDLIIQIACGLINIQNYLVK